MKRLLFILLSAFVSILAWADSEHTISDVNIVVVLNDSGSAHITEKWQMETSTGTEWYMCRYNLGEMHISNFSVKDETGKTYIFDEPWDLDRSLEEKAGHCGINDVSDKDGVEQCWGIGTYGPHTYTLTYDITNMVKQLQDSAAFIYRFINEDLPAEVEHARIEIGKAIPGSWNIDNKILTLENTKMWAFGCNGTIDLVNGVVVFETSEAFPSTDRYVNIMLCFDPKLFPALQEHQDRMFSDMKEKAFDGSTYESDDDALSVWDYILIFGSFIFFIIILPILTLLTYINFFARKRTYGRQKVSGYLRELPYNGDMYAAQFVLCQADHSRKISGIISALILKWIRARIVSIVPNPNGKKIEIAFDHPENEKKLEDNVERRLFEIIKLASGTDYVLQPHEMKQWASLHTEKMRNWGILMVSQGAAYFEKRNMAVHTTYDKLRWDLSKEGKKEACKVMQFKNYLLDFTLLNEREAREVQLWDKYMMYASMLGIAKEVAHQFKSLAPDYFLKSPEEGGYGMDVSDVLYTTFVCSSFSDAMASAITTPPPSASSSSGGGGFSSFGGGGGFSGGGGGGTR
jgi:uncharacterized membrane protein YgcG